VSSPINAAPGYIEVPSTRYTSPKSSLFTVADVITDSNIRWEGGYFVLGPQSPYYTTALTTGCGSINFTGPAECNPITTDPFYLFATESTSAFNFRNKDLYASTLDSLLAVESNYVEYELIYNGLGISSPWLLNPSNNFVPAGYSSAPYSVASGLGWMEEWMANQYLDGLKPMIIVSRRMMAHMVRHTLLRREGNIWLSPNDIPVVAMGAFNGQMGPSGPPASIASEFIYAIAGLQIRRSEIIVIPEREPATADNPFGYPSSAINRLTNDITVTAQRYYGISFVTTTNADTPANSIPVLYTEIDFTLSTP
jgi:hypothetical protein